jgi:hypothetical protein
MTENGRSNAPSAGAIMLDRLTQRSVLARSLCGWALLCALLLLATGCGSDERGSSSSNTDVKIPDTTVVLDQASLAALESVSEDRTSFRFSRSTPLLDRLRAKDVIVAGIFEPLLPLGTLRRVQTIDRSGGAVVLTTVPAALAEAIERAHIRQRIPLREDNVQAVTADGVVQEALGPDGLYFGLNDVVLFDGDGQPGAHDQVVLNGNIGIVPSLDLEIDLDGFSLEEATVAIVGEISGNLNVDARREALLPKAPMKLANLKLGAYVIPVGPIPVVISSDVDLLFGVDGKVTAKMNVGIQSEAEARIGFGYKNGDFVSIHEINPTASVELQSFEDGVIGTARVFAGPQLNLRLYGMPVGFVDLEAYVQADIDSKKNPWWCLEAGVQGKAGVDIEIEFTFILDFTIPIIDWETEPLGKSVSLGCAPGAAPSSQPGGGGSGEEAIQTFARSYGSDNMDNFTTVLPTGDGGALLAGSTNSFSPTPRDAWLMKVDALGHPAWQLAYADREVATDVVEMADGYLFTAGRLGVTVDRLDLVRTDPNGSIGWTKSYDHPDGIGPARIVKTSEGGFLVAGTRSALTAADFFAARFDPAGALVWAKTYGGDDNDDAHAAIATPDGGFLLVGETSSFGVTFTGAWIVKIDAQGNLQWQRVFDQGGNFYGNIAVASPLGGYLIGGHTVGAGLLLRLDAGGAVTWGRYYDAGTDNDYLMAGAAYPDGSFGVVGSRGLGDASELWALRISDPGNVLWSRAIGGAMHESAGGATPYDDAGQPVAVAADGGLLVAAKTQTFSSGFEDGWLLKITKNGYIDLDPQGGATSTALAGDLSNVTLPGTATTVAAQALALTEVPRELARLSTQVTVRRQGGLP